MNSRLKIFHHAGRLLLSVVLIVMLLPACTHNNGDIGDWFGTWRIESITLDGEPAPDYPSPSMIWKFQGKIIQIIVPDDKWHTATGVCGVWSESDGVLFLDFNNEYGPMTSVTHFGVENYLDILELSSKKIVLRYDTEEGTYIYELKKWG